MNNFRKCRLQLGLSLRQVAKLVGCSHGTVANIESGRVDVGYQKAARITEFYKEQLGENYYERTKD